MVLLMRYTGMYRNATQFGRSSRLLTVSLSRRHSRHFSDCNRADATIGRTRRFGPAQKLLRMTKAFRPGLLAIRECMHARENMEEFGAEKLYVITRKDPPARPSARNRLRALLVRFSFSRVLTAAAGFWRTQTPSEAFLAPRNREIAVRAPASHFWRGLLEALPMQGSPTFGLNRPWRIVEMGQI